MKAAVDLAQLRESLINEARVQAIISIFMTDAPRLLASIDQHLSAGQFAELAKVAHTLKGASQYFCSDALVAACQDLEEAALRPAPPEGQLASLVAKVGNACSLVQSALQAERPQPSG
jgi:HPt (histidine-containing phosphotransfer) domain-containing protein